MIRDVIERFRYRLELRRREQSDKKAVPGLLIVVLSGLFLGSVALLLLFFRDTAQGSLGFEVAKSLLQLGVVAVVGAVISLLVFEYQRESQAIDKEVDRERQERHKEADRERQERDKKADRERQALEKERDLDRKRLEYRETLLMSILSRAMDAYGRAKKARRVLRGRSVSSQGQRVVLANQYDIFFDMLNDAQLHLEDLARDVETSAKAFSEPDVLVGHLRSMDTHLGELIREYEKSRQRFSGDESSLPLSELQYLEDFLKPTMDSKFLKRMVVPYHEVQKGIRADLLHPNLPELIQPPNTGLHPTRLC